MIDLESIQNHSRMLQRPPGYHKTTLNDSYSISVLSKSNTATSAPAKASSVSGNSQVWRLPRRILGAISSHSKERRRQSLLTVRPLRSKAVTPRQAV